MTAVSVVPTPDFTVLYIKGTGRCGTTVLDRLISQQAGCVSVGEMRRLQSYARQHETKAIAHEDGLLCSCGIAVTECSFWSQVAGQLGVPLSEVPTSGVEAAQHCRRLLQLAWLAGGLRGLRAASVVVPGGRREHLAAANCWRIYEAVARQTGARLIVDSSKSVYHYLMLRATATRPLLMLDMQRDGRAVVYSMTRGERAKSRAGGKVSPFESAAAAWAQNLRRGDVLVKSLPASEHAVLRYEDMCRDPAAALGQIFRLVGEVRTDFETLLADTPFHNIGGSPSRLEKGRREIRLDEAWRKALEPEQLAAFERLAGAVNRGLGYLD
jgi:hypothetical protein